MAASELAPACEDELAAAVREALNRQEPVEIRGGGSWFGLGNPVQAARVLSTRRMTGIRDYRPGELSLTVAAGAALTDVEEALQEQDQMLAFEPVDPRPLFGTSDCIPTIGGTIATGLSGPRRIVAGGCRDALTGLRFVNGAGELIRTGGRVMKNVTGYNLARLLAGSHGTLGVIAGISLRTAPRPETQSTLNFTGLELDDAIRAMAIAVGSSHRVSGAAFLPREGDTASGTCLRVEGFERSVACRTAALQTALAAFGEADILDAESSVALWKEIRDLRSFASAPGAIWRIAVPPTSAPGLLNAIIAARPAAYLLDQAGAVAWLRMDEGEDAGAATVRNASARNGAESLLVRASAPVRIAIHPFPAQAEPVARILRRVRGKFDPGGILNPAKMGI